jgi:sulfur carrier protein ThiS
MDNGIGPPRAVVELNADVVKKSSYGAAVLADGDKNVEILQ